MCEYRKVKQDGYEAVWKTECGNKVYCEAPIEVGISFPPLPTDDGRKFCAYCGEKIELREKR